MKTALDIVYLVPLLPLLGFVVNGLARTILSKRAVSFIGCGVVLLAFALSCAVFVEVRGGAQLATEYFSFIRVDKLSIPFSFQIDALSTLFLLIITGVGLLIHIYSAAYMHEESAPHYARYFSYLNLFVFFMLVLVMGGNYLVMFIGWEGVGLCSYLLIGFWFRNHEYNRAANKAFIMNRIGDLGFLLALFWLIGTTGTLNFADIFSGASRLSTTDVTIITLLLFVGAAGKSAQIPLYTWLPDAMAGPTPVSALIHAATMVTAGIYMVARSNVLYALAPVSMYVVAIIGLATALVAASIAMRQNDIKKVLAYSTVSQLGYMFLALGVGAFTAGVFHVMTHAFFKALLFLAAGSVIHALGGEQDLRNMGGLGRKLRLTAATFLIGCVAIAGIPPFSGFFSKDAILLSVFVENKMLYAVALLGAMLTAYYMFRLYFLTFSGSFRGTQEQATHVHESPAPMTIPLVILALLSFAGGFVNVPSVFAAGAEYLSAFLSPVIRAGEPPHIPHSTEWMLMGLSTALVLIAILIAWLQVRRERFPEPQGLGKLLANKWYVDELYENIIVRPVHRFGGFLQTSVEKPVIDALVNGVGRAVNYGGRQLRLLQSGQVANYVLLMVISMLAIFVLQFFLRK
ncbi:MAG TPA: NADH-quinone oxidoreductase subunit L [Chitinophagaceae bacterium]|nr:NADH-quinone oxidoreductase subunit L [Chitinophagaceae bacterium]